MALKKLLKWFLLNKHTNKHLFFIESQDMLVLFACASMLQFIFSWKKVFDRALAIHGTFLAAAFVLYVLSRILKRQKDQEALVLVAFASFIFYRVFGEGILGVLPTVHRSSSVSYRTHWIVISMFFCTGLHLKVILAVVGTAFIGLILEVGLSRADDWESWAVDIPMFLHFSAVGLLFYYAFFCIGVEICRLRHRPLRIIRDLPAQFFTHLEPYALSSLPLTVLNKSFSREEHLYILLRITQMPAFRDAALQLIGEDTEFEASLGDKDKLERAFLRSALLQFHLKECPNPTLKNLAGLIAASAAPCSPGMDNEDSQTATSSARRRTVTGTKKRSNIQQTSRKANVGELNLFGSGGGAGGGDKVPERAPLEALASKITVGGMGSNAPTLLTRQSRSVAKESENGWQGDGDSVGSLDTLGRRRFIRKRANDIIEKEKEQNHIGLGRTVTVGTVTFPRLDVDRVTSRIPVDGLGGTGGGIGNTDSKVRVTDYNSSVGREAYCQMGTPAGPRGWWRQSVLNSFRRRSWRTSKGLIAAHRNSVNEVFEQRLLTYDKLLGHTANPMWDPISVQIDSRFRIFQSEITQKWCPCLKRLARWLQGVEAVMGKAQWRHTVITPKRGGWGRFLDTKIERWFLAWLSPVQARQHILLSPLVLVVTGLSLLMTWNLFLIDAVLVGSSQGLSAVIKSIIYLSIRSTLHFGALIGLHTLQHGVAYQGSANSHSFKRRASVGAILGLFVSLLDTLMHQLLIPGRPPNAQFTIMAAATFPVFSQLTTVTQTWVAGFMTIGIFSLVPVFYDGLGSLFEAFEAAFLISIGIAIWFIFISRCILVNYRLLFCRYVLPYLLYLDALQPPKHLPGFSDEEDDSSLSSSTSRSSSSNTDSSHTSSQDTEHYSPVKINLAKQHSHNPYIIEYIKETNRSSLTKQSPSFQNSETHLINKSVDNTQMTTITNLENSLNPPSHLLPDLDSSRMYSSPKQPIAAPLSYRSISDSK